MCGQVCVVMPVTPAPLSSAAGSLGGALGLRRCWGRWGHVSVRSAGFRNDSWDHRSVGKRRCKALGAWHVPLTARATERGLEGRRGGVCHCHAIKDTAWVTWEGSWGQVQEPLPATINQ